MGQGRGCSCPASMPPLELIGELVAITVPGQVHFGRDCNLTATASAQACDDASATRTGPHAPHHTELLATANYVAGPIVTGLAHGYAHGKTCTHAALPEGRSMVAAEAPTPLPSLDGLGYFILSYTGGEYVLLGYPLRPGIDHAPTNGKRIASQTAMQTVAGNTGGTFKAQAIFLNNMVAQGHPLYYNRATLSDGAECAAIARQLRVLLCARGFGHEGCPACVYQLDGRAAGLGLLHDAAITGAALLDDFLAALARPAALPSRFPSRYRWPSTPPPEASSRRPAASARSSTAPTSCTPSSPSGT